MSLELVYAVVNLGLTKCFKLIYDAPYSTFALEKQSVVKVTKRAETVKWSQRRKRRHNAITPCLIIFNELNRPVNTN